MLLNYSESKGNQAMTFVQLIKYNMRNICLQKSSKIEAGKLVPEPFSFFKKALYKVKTSGKYLNFNIFWQTTTQPHNKNRLYVKFQAVDSDICCFVIFYKRVQEQPLHHILRMIFKKRYFSFYILLSDQISLSGSIYLLRYWTIYVLQLFVVQSVTT